MQTSQAKILVVDDDQKLADLTTHYLTQQGFDCSSVLDGETALSYLQQSNPDLVILDLMLPDMDGISVCQKLRQFSQVPVLMLTARNNDFDMVHGLDSGCDDYVAKPVEPRVLLSRVKALLRRSQTLPESSDQICFGALQIDHSARAVSLEGEPIDLTSHEYDLLHFLAKNAGEVVSRENLFQQLVGREYDGIDRSIDIRVSVLRKKLKDNANQPFRIKTIWGQGYLFVANAWN